MKRRDFLQLTAFTGTTGLLAGFQSPKIANADSGLTSQRSMTETVVPISVSEREMRVQKAQRLLTEQKMAALILDAGTSLLYFTGIEWWPSERLMVAIIPAQGEVKYVCPAFEHDRLKEQVTIGKEIYIWQEDQSPYRQVAGVLKDLGIRRGSIGLEERLRFFILDGIRKAAPHLKYVSGDPITIPCRMIKSAAEIKLLQQANDITLASMKAAASQLTEGMAQGDLSDLIMKNQTQLGGRADFALCLFAQASAFPHGTREPQTLKKGDIVLMDCGCVVEGYCSDITRTIVFGAAPTKRQEEIWNLEKKAQAAGFAAARIGTACEEVDVAARKVITDAGFGPGYALPGLPHRTGHGIGMDGHEWGNMVKGNRKLLEPGMCFSIEPTISIVGEFGVRMEDCVYMTETGPQWFSKPSKSIHEPFA